LQDSSKTASRTDPEPASAPTATGHHYNDWHEDDPTSKPGGVPHSVAATSPPEHECNDHGESKEAEENFAPEPSSQDVAIGLALKIVVVANSLSIRRVVCHQRLI
jgi:hypothetical protein